jgi:antitoxin component YwqK of YwqJK toxin-antitoxin module
LEPVKKASLEDPVTLVLLAQGYSVLAERKSVAPGQYILEGRYEAYAKDGHKVVEGTYSDGLPDGRFRYWHDNGRLADEGTYARGQEVGVWRHWYYGGGPLRLETYDQEGRRDGAETYWNLDGSVHSRLEWKSGHIHLMTLYTGGRPSEELKGKEAERRFLELGRNARAAQDRAGQVGSGSPSEP